jgi:hypothetical protein
MPKGSPAGMKDIGHVGNVALPAFNGPPKEVLEQLGLSIPPLGTP